jgi:hypothetical protein
MINNYRGEQVTWDRLFEVLEDYIEGRREYSYSSANGGGCFYRKTEQADCPTACMIGSFMPDNKYDNRFEGNSVSDSNIQKTISVFKDVPVLALYFFQGVHDSLAEGYVGLALENLDELSVPTEYQSRKEDIVTKIEGTKLNV